MTGAEPTLELIARRIEESQIDKFAEFLGQFPCRKSACQQNTKPLGTDAELTFDRIVRDIERLQIEKVAELLGKATYRKMAIITTTLPAQTGC